MDAVFVSLITQTLSSIAYRALEGTNLLAIANPSELQKVLLHLFDESVKGMATKMSSTFLYAMVSHLSICAVV